jgi:hypothetical protein
MDKFFPINVFVVFLSVLIISPVNSQTVPVFQPGEILKFSDGTDLLPAGGNYISVPCVVDWNGDGNKDLLGGYFFSGCVYQYINVGTNSQPSFIHGNEIQLQANGSAISVAYG